MKEPLIMDVGPKFLERATETYNVVMLIPPQNPKMVDERREIHELDEPDEDRSTQAFLVKASGLPLGKHAHGKKTEIFVILTGEVEKLVTAVPRWRESGEAPDNNEPVRTREWEHLGPGTMIIMPPFVFHTFYFKPGTRLICYSTAAFDQKDFIPAELV